MFVCCVTKYDECSNFVNYYFGRNIFNNLLLKNEKVKMTLQKVILKTKRKESTTRGIPRRSPIRVLTSPDRV